MTYDLLRVGNINIVVYSLVVMFAIAFWLNINGLWVELPILVQKLPERWDLPSYMSVVIQVATIGPLVYTIIYTTCPHRNLEVPVIYTIISIEIVVCFLLVFFWDTVKTVGGELHSVGLLGLQFCVAVADTTSTLVCLPFLAAFQPQYLTAFYIGEGLSGLLPSLVSLAQGAGDISCYNFTTMQNVSDDNKTVTVAESASKPLYQNPRFSVEILFVILLGLLVLSLLSFMLLNVWNYARRTAGDEKFALQDQECHNHSKLPNTECELKLQSTVKGTSLTCAESPETSVHCCNGQVSPPGSGDEVGDVAFDKQQDQEVRVELKVIERRHDALLLILIGWISSLAYGVLPSVQPYSCLPYGIHAYHIVVTLTGIVRPMACFVTMILPVTSLKVVTALVGVGSLLSSCALYTSATSPEPPLWDHTLGPFFVVTLWVLLTFILTYSKVVMGIMLRLKGKRALLWGGVFTQGGSVVGTVITFLLINVCKLFKQTTLCS